MPPDGNGQCSVRFLAPITVAILTYILPSDLYHVDPDFSTVASIYCAAAALQFPKFLDFAEGYLELKFEDNSKSVTCQGYEFAVEAVLLGRNWGLPTILKRAFYDLARSAPEEGEKNEREGEGEGAVVGAKEVSHGKTNMGVEVAVDVNNGNGNEVRSNGLDRLDPTDLVRLLKAQKRLAASWLHVITFKRKKCPQKEGQCPSSSTRVTNIIQNLGFTTKYLYDPICGIRKLYQVEWNAKGYCESCSANIISHFMDQEKHIWDNLHDWLCIHTD